MLDLKNFAAAGILLLFCATFPALAADESLQAAHPCFLEITPPNVSPVEPSTIPSQYKDWSPMWVGYSRSADGPFCILLVLTSINNTGVVRIHEVTGKPYSKNMTYVAGIGIEEGQQSLSWSHIATLAGATYQLRRNKFDRADSEEIPMLDGITTGRVSNTRRQLWSVPHLVERARQKK